MIAAVGGTWKALAAFQALQRRFAAGAPVSLSRLRDSAERVAADPYDTTALLDLTERAQTLAQAARFYAPTAAVVHGVGGEGSEGGLAGACERLREEAAHAHAEGLPGPELVERWLALVAALPRLLEQQWPEAAEGEGAAEAEDERLAAGAEALVVHAPGVERDRLARALRFCGLSVRLAADRAAAATAMRQRLPSAVLCDARLAPAGGVAIVEALRALPGGMRPLIAWLGAPADATRRLAAHRAGVDLCLGPSSSPQAAAWQVRAALMGQRRLTADLMLIDGDSEALARRQRLLEGAGHRVHAAVDPMKALRAALQESPDLVIAATSLPGMRGAEWLWVWRSTDAGALATPTIGLVGPSHGEVLAGDPVASDVERRDINAFDALLPASAAPGRLLATFESALRRQRARAAASDLDPVTGALSPLAFAEQLQEYCNRDGRASRDRAPVALVSLDLRGLRRHNLRHGFAVGDLLLHTVASALREAVPMGAWIGRVGASTVMALVELDADAAQQLAIAIIKTASTLRVPAPDGRLIAVQVRAGAAPFRADRGLASAWIDAAQAAMSQSASATDAEAKSGGKSGRTLVLRPT